jgi:hypothetical protein
MGVHVRILVTHDVPIADARVENVEPIFASMDDVFNEVAVYFSRWWPRLGPPLEAWRDVTEPGSAEPDHFHGPAGLFFSFGPQVLCMSHMTKFHSFCTVPEETALLRRFSYRVLGLLGGERAIYCPDCGVGDEVYDLVHEGKTLMEIEAHLRRMGAPAATFSELGAGPAARYYIDGFDDFCVYTAKAG